MRRVKIKTRTSSSPRTTRTRRKTGLDRGELTTHKLIVEACKEVGEDNPVVQKCIGIVLKIANREPGYNGRYVGEQLRAASMMLDRVLGRPKEHEPKKKQQELPNWNFQPAKSVTYQDALKNAPAVSPEDLDDEAEDA